MKIHKILIAFVVVVSANSLIAQESEKQQYDVIEAIVQNRLKERWESLQFCEKMNAEAMDLVQKTMKHLVSQKKSGEISEAEYNVKMKKVKELDLRIKKNHDKLFKLQSNVLISQRQMRRMNAEISLTTY
ncbi:hypothetical protein EV195_10574 [Tenacibaculum skagerrakense]|uniref:LTXXQ motif family protein n=1 Tax=Tenacibaculum skagerrakense TaxID=186571 RepID=A0A4R2NRU1_9FLAO|nr:hypothetical protein [Tenacibaculum skagerrakense]TCP24643.1 hypothetical protein EV195_10574 [Tenacibaculum skagerrakense]